MTLLETHAREGRFARINPVAKLGASALIAVPLILTLDVVSAAVALLLECLLFPFAGIGWREFWLRTFPVRVAAPLTALTIALYGETSGTIYFEWFVIRVSEGSIALAAATFFRVLAIALLGRAVRHRRPHRPRRRTRPDPPAPRTVRAGRLAGLRMVGLFLDDWRALELARRARGVADRGRLRRFAGMAFALLVLSIRRGSKLATAMEARGFGAPGGAAGRGSRDSGSASGCCCSSASASGSPPWPPRSSRARGTSSSGRGEPVAAGQVASHRSL